MKGHLLMREMHSCWISQLTQTPRPLWLTTDPAMRGSLIQLHIRHTHIHTLDHTKKKKKKHFTEHLTSSVPSPFPFKVG